MALAIAGNRISREEYLEGELASEIRLEYVAGSVYAMSGGTLNHQRIAGNFVRLAGNQLAGTPCFPTGSDFKLLVPLGSGDEAFYYPDGMIICVPVPGDALYTDSTSVILEVLSPSTRRDGTGFRREIISGLDAVLELPEAGVSIPLAELYRDVG